MNGDLIRRHEILSFYLLSLLIISAAAGAVAATGIEALVLPGVVGPAIAAFTVARVAGGTAATADLRAQVVRWRVAPGWYVVAVALLPLLAVAAVTMSTGGLPEASGSVFPAVLILLVLMTGEEIGWRGFMLPRLQRTHSALSASLILGLAWGLWHFPGYLIGMGVPLNMSFPTFLLWVVGATILFTWVYNHTRSVLLAIIMHVCANLAFGALPLLPEQTGESRTFMLFVGLVWLFAAAVVLVFGPRTLTRRTRTPVS